MGKLINYYILTKMYKLYSFVLLMLWNLYWFLISLFRLEFLENINEKQTNCTGSVLLYNNNNDNCDRGKIPFI